MAHEKRLFAVVLIAKLLLLFVVVVIFGGGRLLWGDSITYVNLGKAIFQGDDMVGETAIMPLYPFVVGFFVTYFSGGLIFIAILQAILAAFNSALIYNIAIRFLSRSYAYISALLFAFEPVGAILNLLIMTETILVFFVLLFIYFFLRYLEVRKPLFIFYAALALGFSVMVKAVMVYAFVIPVAFLLFDQRVILEKRFKQGIFFWITFSFVLVPWMARNYVLANQFKVTLEGAGNVCGYQLPLVFAVENNIGITTQSLNANPEFQKLYARCQHQSELRNIFGLAYEYPRAFVKANMLAALAFFTNDGLSTLFQKNNHGLPIHHNYLTPMVFMGGDWRVNIEGGVAELSAFELTGLLVAKAAWLFIFIFFLIGLYVLSFRRKEKIGLFFISLVIYITAVNIASTSFALGARLRYPIVPLLFIIGMIGIEVSISRFRKSYGK